MDDLISRKAGRMNNQQAINLLKDLEQSLDDYYGLNDEGKTAFGMAITALELFGNTEQLPSAQPEIIRCKDCKYFDPLTEDFDYNFCDAWAGGTNEDMFCGFAERRQDADSSGNMSGTQKELKCTETHSCDYQRTETHESCTDCPLYDHDRHNCPRFNRVIPATIEEAKPRWIPVSEALPNDGVEVWVTIKGHDVIRCEEGKTLEQAIDRINKIRWVTRGYWSDEEHAWNDPSFAFPLMVQPIAWMPIDTPEPWKGR